MERYLGKRQKHTHTDSNPSVFPNVVSVKAKELNRGSVIGAPGIYYRKVKAREKEIWLFSRLL